MGLSHHKRIQQEDQELEFLASIRNDIDQLQKRLAAHPTRYFAMKGCAFDLMDKLLQVQYGIELMDEDNPYIQAAKQKEEKQRIQYADWDLLSLEQLYQLYTDVQRKKKEEVLAHHFEAAANLRDQEKQIEEYVLSKFKEGKL